MLIDFVAKNYSPSEKLKEVVAKKVDRLDKFFESDQRVRILFKQVGDVFTLELTIVVDNGVLRAEVNSDNMYNNIDLALPKLEKQIIKHHKRIASKSKKFRDKMITEAEAKEAEAARAVVKKKTYKLTPMSIDEAIEEQELVGHSFFVFLNKEENRVNILYRRNDGNYGVIEVENE